MINWSFPPDLQERYDKIVAETRRLQKELGIEPRTMEQRHQDYLKKQTEKQHKEAELKKLQQSVGLRRPPPKWKV